MGTRDFSPDEEMIAAVSACLMEAGKFNITLNGFELKPQSGKDMK